MTAGSVLGRPVWISHQPQKPLGGLGVEVTGASKPYLPRVLLQMMKARPCHCSLMCESGRLIRAEAG